MGEKFGTNRGGYLRNIAKTICMWGSLNLISTLLDILRYFHHLHCDLNRPKFLRNIKPLYFSRIDELGAHFIWVWKPWMCATTQCKYFCNYYRSLTSSSTANAVAPTATPKVVKFLRAIMLDSNLILSGLNALDEFIRFIGTSNRPIGTLFGPRNRAGNCASFAKSYLSFGVQMNKSTQKQWFPAKIRYLSGGSEVLWT